MTTTCEHGGDWCARRTDGDPRKTPIIWHRSRPPVEVSTIGHFPTRRAGTGGRGEGKSPAQRAGSLPTAARLLGLSAPKCQKAAIPIAREDKLSGFPALPPAHLIFSSIHIELPALSGRLGHGIQDASRAKRKRSAEHEPNGQNRRRHLAHVPRLRELGDHGNAHRQAKRHKHRRHKRKELERQVILERCNKRKNSTKARSARCKTAGPGAFLSVHDSIIVFTLEVRLRIRFYAELTLCVVWPHLVLYAERISRAVVNLPYCSSGRVQHPCAGPRSTAHGFLHLPRMRLRALAWNMRYRETTMPRREHACAF